MTVWSSKMVIFAWYVTISRIGCILETKLLQDGNKNKKIQQSWQTSALAVHLPLARLVSTCVIFCLLPSSGIVILVFYLFFCRHQWTTCVRTVTVSVNTVHWFDASCSGTPVNNSITLISPVQSLCYIFTAGSICAALQISVQFSPKARIPTH